MSKRLIYAEDAIEALEALFVKQIKQFDYESYEKADEKTQLVCDGISDSIECVLNLPSAQPQRIKGRWIGYAGTIGAECSECHKWLDVIQGTAEMNYCPNCGADMRGDEDVGKSCTV